MSTANQSKPHDTFLKPPAAQSKPFELSPASKTPVEEAPALKLKPQISTISKEKAPVVEEPKPAGEVKVDSNPSILPQSLSSPETQPANEPLKTNEAAKAEEPKVADESKKTAGSLFDAGKGTLFSKPDAGSNLFGG